MIIPQKRPHLILIGDQGRNDPIFFEANNEINQINWLKEQFGENVYIRAVKYSEYIRVY